MLFFQTEDRVPFARFLDFSSSLDTDDFLNGFPNFAEPMQVPPMMVPALNSTEINEIVGMNPNGRLLLNFYALPDVFDVQL